jgi:hypothetical protein
MLRSAADIFARARQGDARGLRELLESDRFLRYEVNFCDARDWTPLYVACRAGHTEAARVLLENGADVDWAKDSELALGVTALHAAAHFGHANATRLLLDAGASPNSSSEKGTPLFMACQRGHAEVARLLLARGAAVDATDDIDGATALLIACQEKHTDAARRCLEARADVDRAAHNGMTPLYMACEDGNLDLAILLSEYGAKREGPRNDPWSAEGLARTHGHLELLGWLRQSREWVTPLHHVAHLSTSRVRGLLRGGVALDARAAPGAASPLELAQRIVESIADECPQCVARQALDRAGKAGEAPVREEWVRCSDKFAGRRCRGGQDCSNRKCGFDHPRGWQHLKSPLPPPSTLPELPLLAGVCEGCESRRAARMVVDAAAAWSPDTNGLWPDAARMLAIELIKLGWLVSRTDGSPGPFVGEEQAMMDVWIAHIMPRVLHRSHSCTRDR